MLTKEIEVDETYVTHCRKGRKIEGHPGKKRGTPARKRGLSKEKICILTAVQRSGNCIARSFNVAKPRIDDVLQFSRCIEDKSYVWTDGLASYQKVLEEKRCENKILVSYKSYDSVNHLNNVNSFVNKFRHNIRVIKVYLVNTSIDITPCSPCNANILEWIHKKCYV